MNIIKILKERIREIENRLHMAQEFHNTYDINKYKAVLEELYHLQAVFEEELKKSCEDEDITVPEMPVPEEELEEE